MKRKSVLRVLVFAVLFFAFSCVSDYQNEMQRAIVSSDKFYESFDADRLQEISENQIDLSRENTRRFKLSEKLKIIKDAFGRINTKTLKKTEVGSADKDSIAVFCTYEINTENGVHYQKLIWQVDKENAKLADAQTYSYNQKGEMQLMVVDGKIIL